MKPIIVIGGGAAGLMAAGTAARNGKQVLVIEKNARPARKVMITGKGRCNVTNACEPVDFLPNVINNRSFLYSALYGFTPADMICLLEDTLKVPLKIERGNRVFPVSDRAVDIVDALYDYASGAKFRFNSTVKSILIADHSVTGVQLDSGEQIEASSVIVATGGLSYPLTGSTGDGYRFASDCGHTVTPTGPSLISMESRDAFCKDLMGLSLKNVSFSVENRDNGHSVYSELGEMLFTHFGISGPLVLSASCHLQNKNYVDYIGVIDLKPGLDEQKLDARLVREIAQNPQRSLRNLLGSLLPAKMIPVMLKRCDLSGERKAAQITREERKRLVNQCKRFTVDLYRPRNVEEAVITFGGVDVCQVDPKTMASKLIEGLYFAGEVLDVDAYTGGFNLQIAFSTGYAAGNAAI